MDIASDRYKYLPARILNGIKTAALYIGLIVVCNSCQPDDSFEPPGSFSLEGDERPLDKGYFSEWNTLRIGRSTFYEWNLILTSQGVTFDPRSHSFSGKGSVLLLVIAARNNPQLLPGGTYTINGRPNGNFVVFGGTYPDLNTDTGEGTVLKILGDAILQMKKTGDNYAMAFTFILGDGRKVTGSYVGKLLYEPAN